MEKVKMAESVRVIFYGCTLSFKFLDADNTELNPHSSRVNVEDAFLMALKERNILNASVNITREIQEEFRQRYSGEMTDDCWWKVVDSIANNINLMVFAKGLRRFFDEYGVADND